MKNVEKSAWSHINIIPIYKIIYAWVSILCSTTEEKCNRSLFYEQNKIFVLYSECVLYIIYHERVVCWIGIYYIKYFWIKSFCFTSFFFFNIHGGLPELVSIKLKNLILESQICVLKCILVYTQMLNYIWDYRI